MIYERGVNTRHLFCIEIVEDGTYVAVRDVEPMFCFHGNTIQEVANVAQSAFESYKKYTAKK